MARLIISAPTGEETIELQPGEVVTVGRDATNRIPLPDDTQASRRHCRIGPREGGVQGWEVVDLGSTNKTRVGGSAIQRRVLAHGDVVEVGHATIRFEDPDEAKRLADAESQGICFLEWANKERAGERVLLDKPRISLGRRETNTVVLDDRMASGHHCEIDKDVNGYTIRDLGSTNGTLVNGELITEALLSHGARVRVGNGRFVFKDPSMKDIEVELSQFEEDEGWGMMGDIDLSRSRGSRGSLLAVLLLFAVAAAGGWFLSQRDAGEAQEGDVGRSGLLANGDFEKPELGWSVLDDERASVRLLAKQGRGGSAALAVTGAGEGDGVAVYDEAIDVTADRPLRLKAFLKGRGEGHADLVAIWSSRPTEEELKAGLVTPTQRTDVLGRGEGAWAAVDTLLGPPAWARELRVGVRVDANASAVLDDLSLLPSGEAHDRAERDVPSFKTISIDGRGALDLMQNRILLLTGARPVATIGGGEATAFEADGEPVEEGEDLVVRGQLAGPDGPVPATVRWRVTPEGLLGSVEVAGAAAVGLAAALPQAHLSGALSVIGDFPPQRIPAKPGESLAKVARTLAGDADPVGNRPATLVSFMQPDDQPISTLHVHELPGSDLVVLQHWVEGDTATMAIVTDFRLQEQQAKKDLAEARSLMRTAPARAFIALRRVAQAYPFDESVRDEAMRLAGELEERTLKDLDALELALHEFRIYRSPAALDVLRERSDAMAAQFLAETDEEARRGPIVERVAAVVQEVDAARREYRMRSAQPEFERLERLVGLLGNVEGYQPVAAVYARAMLDRYADLGELEPDVKRRLDAARERLEKLVSLEGVRDAMPPAPEAP